MAAVMAARAAVKHKKARDEEERKRIAAAQAESDKKCLEMVAKYAGEGASGLEHDQLKACLADIAKDVAKSDDDFVTPTDEETTFVLRMCVQDENRNAVEPSEVEEAVTIWGTFLMLRSQISKDFERFDHDKSGKLDKDQLREYMTSCCCKDDPDVTEEDITWLLDKTDIVRDGQIGKIEWVFCSSVWNRELVKRRNERKAQKSGVCAVL